MVTTAFADPGEPAGACPPAFELRQIMDGDPMHEHIGANEDLNEDSYFCVQYLPNDLHLHMDNYLPLP